MHKLVDKQAFAKPELIIENVVLIIKIKIFYFSYSKQRLSIKLLSTPWYLLSCIIVWEVINVNKCSLLLPGGIRKEIHFF